MQFVLKALKNNIVLTIIFDIIFVLIATVVFVVGLQFCNYGQFRLFLLINYIFGFVLQKISIGDLVAKFFKLIYNLVIKITKNKKVSTYDTKKT